MLGGRDAGRNLVGPSCTRMPPSTRVNVQVNVAVAAKPEPPEAKSTAATTRSSGSASTILTVPSNHSVSVSGSVNASKTRLSGALTTRDALSVRTMPESYDATAES
ncbi:hypothetical protein [Mycolicibacterium phlei]